MVDINFDNIDDVKDFEPLPGGQYQVRLIDAVESTTRNGDEMWKLKFVVSDGPSKGRYIFDNLVFSQAAMSRVKLLCRSLGLDTTGKVELTTGMLQDRCCTVTVYTEEYEDFEGYTKTANRVPFNGYDAAPQETGTTNAPPSY